MMLIKMMVLISNFMMVMMDGDADDDGDEIGVRPNIVLEASAILGRVCQPVSSSRPALTMLCS